MPCFSPLTAYYGDIGKSGKRGITFNRGASFSGLPIKVPCGQCIGCRLEKSRQWAMRCLHEKRLHRDSCFLTLTYDNDHLPGFGTLVKRDLQLFMKRLRNARGEGIRFYACGEYGDLNMRPHYHVLLFGVDFPDKKFYKNAKRGEKLYTSEEVAGYWSFGYNVIGDVSFDSAAYVARYVMKKMTGVKADSHYDVVDGNGEVFRREREFTNMSRRPGIGKGWYDKFGSETYIHDSVVVNGREVRPPRYYDGKFELSNPDDFAKLKAARKKKVLTPQVRADNTIERRRVRERVQQLNLKDIKREV